jgi:putative hydrolase of the HAD superfamily
MNEEIKALVFDLDDTLHDLRKYTFSSFYYVAHQLSKETGFDWASLYLAMCKHYDEAWWRSKIFNRLLEALGIPEVEGLVSQCKVWFHEAGHKDESLFQDTISVLHLLKGRYRLGLLVDGHEERQRKKLRELNIDNYFDDVVIVEGADEKPSPKGFIQISQALNVQPVAVLFVGDNPYRDMMGALSLDMQVAWMRGNSVWAMKELPPQLFTKPIFEMYQLADVFKILKN